MPDQLERTEFYRVVGTWLGAHHITRSFPRVLAEPIYRAWKASGITENIRLQSSTDGVTWEDVTDE